MPIEALEATACEREATFSLWFDIPIQRFTSLLEGFTSSRSSSWCLAITSVHSRVCTLRLHLFITMYIWKVNALIYDLRRGHIGRLDKVKYGAFLFTMASLCWLGINDSHLDSTLGAASILAAQILSIHICRCTNTHGDNRQFWVRMCALGVPVGLRLLCMTTFAIFFSSLPSYMTRKVLGNAVELIPILSNVPSAFLLAIVILIWGARVSAHIDRVASAPLQSDHTGIVAAFTASSR